MIATHSNEERLNEAGEPQITNTCGVCSELTSKFDPDISVIVDDDEEVVVARVSLSIPECGRRRTTATLRRPW
jgi:hypothetical protein